MQKRTTQVNWQYGRLHLILPFVCEHKHKCKPFEKWISCQAYEDRLRKSKRKCPQNALYLAISSKQQHFSCRWRKWEEKRRERAHTNERTDFYDKNSIPNANNRQRRYKHIGPFLLSATHKPFMIIITNFFSFASLHTNEAF